MARLLEIDDMLDRRAANLSPDAKQKISLGRGIARADAAAILFDEPLTVIDPRLKWRLRGSLKRLHRRVDFTMIYVTHDQTEALTFADRVIVMRDGGWRKAARRASCSIARATLSWGISSARRG